MTSQKQINAHTTSTTKFCGWQIITQSDGNGRDVEKNANMMETNPNSKMNRAQKKYNEPRIETPQWNIWSLLLGKYDLCFICSRLLQFTHIANFILRCVIKTNHVNTKKQQFREIVFWHPFGRLLAKIEENRHFAGFLPKSHNICTSLISRQNQRGSAFWRFLAKKRRPARCRFLALIQEVLHFAVSSPTSMFAVFSSKPKKAGIFSPNSTNLSILRKIDAKWRNMMCKWLRPCESIFWICHRDGMAHWGREIICCEDVDVNISCSNLCMVYIYIYIYIKIYMWEMLASPICWIDTLVVRECIYSSSIRRLVRCADERDLTICHTRWELVKF